MTQVKFCFSYTCIFARITRNFIVFFCSCAVNKFKYSRSICNWMQRYRV